MQRRVAEKADLVAEGRDMTTVVFPAAYRKFYLDASVEERARRRALELGAKGLPSDMDSVMSDIIERDARDSQRSLAPLRMADDACIIDTTGLSIDEVYQEMMEVIGKQ
jgi:cytidylate kinase